MTRAAFSPTLTMNDGARIPQLGLGVYKVADAEATTLVAGAIESGYRHIDTAKLYLNEKGVGDGMRASGVPREELFVTTKLWDDDHGYEQTLGAFEKSRAKLHRWFYEDRVEPVTRAELTEAETHDHGHVPDAVESQGGQSSIGH